MPEGLPSDHPSLETRRARVVRSGGTRRLCLRLPDDAALEAGDLVRLVLDGEECHARIEADATGLLVRAAHDNRRLARERGAPAPGQASTERAPNRLVEWLERHDREPETSVDLDVVDPGHRYGVRVPGDRTVYTVTDRPDESLAAIAERLEGER